MKATIHLSSPQLCPFRNTAACLSLAATMLCAGTYWEVQDTLLQDVDRIEIIRGPGATVWGPNAVNGVINIITKKARETHGAMVASGAGSDQAFLDFRYGGGNGNNLDYRV